MTEIQTLQKRVLIIGTNSELRKIAEFLDSIMIPEGLIIDYCSSTYELDSKVSGSDHQCDKHEWKLPYKVCITGNIRSETPTGMSTTISDPQQIITHLKGYGIENITVIPSKGERHPDYNSLGLLN